MKSGNSIINRYTSIPFLIDILWKKRLLLLSPSNWEDRNDRYYLLQYQKKKNLKTLLAICFTSSRERYHHWKVFANSIGGICIEIDREGLVKLIKQNKYLKYGNVNYHKISELEKNKPNVDDMPFIKRDPFKDESEFRIIYECTNAYHSEYELKIDLDIIKKITFSPNIPLLIFKTIEEFIKQNIPNINFHLNRSTLLENEQWKQIADEV